MFEFTQTLLTKVLVIILSISNTRMYLIYECICSKFLGYYITKRKESCLGIGLRPCLQYLLLLFYQTYRKIITPAQIVYNHDFNNLMVGLYAKFPLAVSRSNNIFVPSFKTLKLTNALTCLM